jgi:hypothetical protein
MNGNANALITAIINTLMIPSCFGSLSIFISCWRRILDLPVNHLRMDLGREAEEAFAKRPDSLCILS